MEGIPGWNARISHIPLKDATTLEGNLNIPEKVRGVVLFAHGSGSSRFSPRNQEVAQTLYHTGFATLLMDLLTPDEDEADRVTARLRFDIPLLSQRVVLATNWLMLQPEATRLPIGYFGASTGAAAALVAAARRPIAVKAVVSRGGRPDLAGSSLEAVQAPTLLLVGSKDTQVIELNRAAYSLLRCEKSLEIISGASHLFEEPGALEQVARHAAAWFQRHLSG